MSVKPLDLSLPYMVADMAQADWGRKEMQLSENEMPGLMAVIAKYGQAKPLEAGIVHAGHRRATPPRPRRPATEEGLSVFKGDS